MCLNKQYEQTRLVPLLLYHVDSVILTIPCIYNTSTWCFWKLTIQFWISWLFLGTKVESINNELIFRNKSRKCANSSPSSETFISIVVFGFSKVLIDYLVLISIWMSTVNGESPEISFMQSLQILFMIKPKNGCRITVTFGQYVMLKTKIFFH